MKSKFKNMRDGLIAAFTLAVVGVALTSGTRGFSNRESAEQTLQQMGYTNINYHGHPWIMFHGRKGDMFSSEFTATPPEAKHNVSIVVTSGPFRDKNISIK